MRVGAATASRGLIAERVSSYAAGDGQVLTFEDERVTGVQRVRFETDGVRTRITVTMDLETKTALAPARKWWLLRQLRGALNRSLARFSYELAAERELARVGAMFGLQSGGSSARATRRTRSPRRSRPPVVEVARSAGDAFDGLGDVDLVIEAMPERMSIKHRVIALGCLILRQNLQSTRSEFRVDNHRLQRNDQGVAAEQSHEPRQSCGRHEHHVICALQRKPQRRHVLNALIIAAIELLVAGLHFQNGSLPLVDVARVARRGAGIGTFLRCPGVFRAIHEVVDQAAMPGLPGLQCNVETQAPVGVYRRLAVAVAGSDDYFTAKILIAISSSEVFPAWPTMR